MTALFTHSPNLLLPAVLFLLAFFVSIHATGLLQRLAWALGIVDHPGARKTQTSPVPYLGGVAIYAGLVLALLIAVWFSERWQWGDLGPVGIILIAATLVLLVGLADDIWGISALLKLAALAAVCLFLCAHGIGVHPTPWPAANYILTFLWVAGVSSAFNAIDNTDGLAGTVSLVSCAALFLLGWATWQLPFSFLTMALAGGILGFLHHNMNPAKIYMGDCGSFLLGFLISVLVVFGEWSDSTLHSLLAGGLVVAFPVYDLGLTSLLRLRHGVVTTVRGVIEHSDTDHLSHRLRLLGHSHRRMLANLTGLHLAACLTALLVARRPVWTMVVSFVLLGLLLAVFGRYADRASRLPGLWRVGKPTTRPAADR